MSPVVEVGLVSARELRKNLRSAKGIVLLVLCLLGGLLAAVALAKLAEVQRDKLAQLDPEQAQMAKQAIIESLGDPELGKALVEAPPALLTFFEISIWLTPLLVALLGFDAISGEIQHRTVRYWTVRSRRPSFYVGKVLGLWGLVSAMTLVMHALVWALAIARGEPAGVTLAWGARLWLVSLPMSLVWCGLAQLVSSLFRAPILALLVTFATFFTIWLVYLIGGLAKMKALLFVYPNYYDTWLLHPRLDRAIGGLAICIGMAIAYVAVGALVFARRDV